MFVLNGLICSTFCRMEQANLSVTNSISKPIHQHYTYMMTFKGGEHGTWVQCERAKIDQRKRIGRTIIILITWHLWEMTSAYL